MPAKITLEPLPSEQSNPTSEPLDLGQSEYDFSYLVFPNDLGREDNAHYMIININVPIRNDEIKPAGLFWNMPGFGKFLENDKSKVDMLRFPNNLNPGWTDGITNVPPSPGTPSTTPPPPVDRAALAIPRRTRRISKSIALHMPTPLVFNTHNMYEEISLSALAGKIGSAAIGTIFGVGSPWFKGVTDALTAAANARKLADGAGNIIGGVAKLAQSPINPAVEILFANTLVRQFTIEVLMAPRNEQESRSMHTIIKTLRFHGAPELSDREVPLIGSGLFWIPPAEFDITFFHKGVENMNILRINTCVLERIEVDYAPTGLYSTFKNGHPVAARLSMGFRELEPIHKLRVLQGF